MQNAVERNFRFGIVGYLEAGLSVNDLAAYNAWADSGFAPTRPAGPRCAACVAQHVARGALNAARCRRAAAEDSTQPQKPLTPYVRVLLRVNPDSEAASQLESLSQLQAQHAACADTSTNVRCDGIKVRTPLVQLGLHRYHTCVHFR